MLFLIDLNFLWISLVYMFLWCGVCSRLLLRPSATLIWLRLDGPDGECTSNQFLPTMCWNDEFLPVPMINLKIRQLVMVHSWTLSWMFSLLWLSLSILLLTFFSAVWLSFSQTFVCCRDFSWKEGSLRTEGGSHSWWDVLSLSLSIMLMIQVCCLEMLPDCSLMWIRCMFSCAGT